MKLPIITGEKIKDDNGSTLEVVLMDTDTGESSPPPKVLQIELVPLLGNFPRDYWDADDFQRGVVEDLEKRPLLAGDYRLITMWDGRATVNEFMFTDNSLMCGCMFRIGMRVIPGSYHGGRILEAVTEAFMVRDRDEYKLDCNGRYKWQLAFQSQPRLPIYPGSMITDIIGNPLEVILVDRKTGSPSALPVRQLDIELVPVSEFKLQDATCFPLERAIVKQSKVKPLLSGDVRVTMKEDGSATVNELWFTGPWYGYGSKNRLGMQVLNLHGVLSYDIIGLW